MSYDDDDDDDDNPLQYLIESAPKSAKLMRWSLALQEFPSHLSIKVGKPTQQTIVFLRCESNYIMYRPLLVR